MRKIGSVIAVLLSMILASRKAGGSGSFNKTPVKCFAFLMLLLFAAPISIGATSPDWFLYNNNTGGNMDVKYFNGTDFTGVTSPGGTQNRNLECKSFGGTGIICSDSKSNTMRVYILNATSSNTLGLTTTITVSSSSWSGSGANAILNYTTPIAVMHGTNDANFFNLYRFMPNGSLFSTQEVVQSINSTDDMSYMQIHLFNASSDKFAVVGQKTSSFLMIWNGSAWSVNITSFVRNGGTGSQGRDGFACPDIGDTCILYSSNYTSNAIGNQTFYRVYRNNYTMAGPYVLQIGDGSFDGRHSRGDIQAQPVPGTDKILIATRTYNGNNNMYIFLLNSTSTSIPEGGYPTMDSSVLFSSTGFTDVRHMDSWVDRVNNRAGITYIDSNANVLRMVYYDKEDGWSTASVASAPSWTNPMAPGTSIQTLKTYTNVFDNETVLSIVDVNKDVWSGMFWSGTNFTGTPRNITGDIEHEGSLFFEYVDMDQFIGTVGGPDTQAPVISSLTNATTTNQSVTITWSTNENANESNTMGVCPSFTGVFSAVNTSYTTSHIELINGLSVNTNYCFNTTACDTSGNCAFANVSFFTAQNQQQQQNVNESEGDSAILAGIQSSEIWTATVHDAYQVGAANTSNQFRGTFDKFAIKGNKRWALNYVSSGESSISGLFNITPTLYVLQLQNKTSTQITDEVGRLINSTYP